MTLRTQSQTLEQGLQAIRELRQTWKVGLGAVPNYDCLTRRHQAKYFKCSHQRPRSDFKQMKTKWGFKFPRGETNPSDRKKQVLF